MHNIGLAESLGRPVIAQVVDEFYNRIRTHATLAAPFGAVADWPLHKERLTYFWWVVLGGARDRDFQYHVGTKHFQHGFTRALLADWLLLFEQTVRDLVPAAQAEAWLMLARRMGEGLAVANDQMHARHQENPHAPLDFSYPGTRPDKRQAAPRPGLRPGLEDFPARPA